MTAPRSTTAVVVVNYGSSDLLRKNLTRLHAERPDLHMVVVDNFTDVNEQRTVTELCSTHGWRLIASETNRGFGAGVNAGAHAAIDDGAELLVLLNPDAQIDGTNLDRLCAVVTDDPRTLACPVITTSSGRIWFDGSDLYLADGRTRATRKRPPGADAVEMWLTGACLAVSRQLWEALGGFDERYFLYWEDVDLSWRARGLGAQLLVVRDAVAVHDEGGTQQPSHQRERSASYYYFNIRNRLLFAALHLDAAARRRWRQTALGAAYDIVARGGRRQLLRSRAPWQAAMRGTRDGLRLLRSQGRLRVIESFPTPRVTTNPYIVMLLQALRGDARLSVDTFTWLRALTQTYDVFHAHWPETLLSGRTPLRALVRQVQFAALVVRLRLTRTAVVRTQHNLELPEGLSRRAVWLLQALERQTTLRIILNATVEQQDRPVEVIVHGHYRDWFASYPRAIRSPGRLSYFGLVRRYKAVDTLLRAFSETASTDPDLTLVVGGQPSSEELRRSLEDLAAVDPRISLHLEFLSDAELVNQVSAADLVVLPYREMHNSGSVLAALSLDRPVLVPDNEVNRRLAAEVGEAWVRRFSGALTGSHLRAALADLPAADSSPDLSVRDWGAVADAHRRAFIRAVELRRNAQRHAPR